MIEADLGKVYFHIYLHLYPNSELVILIDDKVSQLIIFWKSPARIHQGPSRKP